MKIFQNVPSKDTDSGLESKTHVHMSNQQVNPKRASDHQISHFSLRRANSPQAAW